jgi:hypothetical protein
VGSEVCGGVWYPGHQGLHIVCLSLALVVCVIRSVVILNRFDPSAEWSSERDSRRRGGGGRTL